MYMVIEILREKECVFQYFKGMVTYYLVKHSVHSVEEANLRKILFSKDFDKLCQFGITIEEINKIKENLKIFLIKSKPTK